jgi:hypothetical protein
MTDISIRSLKGELSTPLSGGFLAGIRSFFSMLDAACACSSAIEDGRTPDARDLRQLGIDPKTFPAPRAR